MASCPSKEFLIEGAGWYLQASAKVIFPPRPCRLLLLKWIRLKGEPEIPDQNPRYLTAAERALSIGIGFRDQL